MGIPIPGGIPNTGGARPNNGTLPLTRQPDPITPSNTTSDRRNDGTMSLAGTTGVIKPPNHAFAAGRGGPRNVPGASEPGSPDLQVGPQMAGNVPSGLDIARADTARALATRAALPR